MYKILIQSPAFEKTQYYDPDIDIQGPKKLLFRL